MTKPKAFPDGHAHKNITRGGIALCKGWLQRRIHARHFKGGGTTHGAGGVMFRFGTTHLKGDLSPPNLNPNFPGASFFDTKKRYFFAGHDSRIMARNIFLDDNTFGDSASIDKERLVGDDQFEFAVHVNKVRIAISNMIRTKENTTQKDQMQYGAINFSFSL